MRIGYILLVMVLCASCGKNTKNGLDAQGMASSKNDSENKIFTMLGTRQTGIHFRNNLPETVEMNGLLYEYYYNGAGVTLGDFNGDGLDDIFFVSNLMEHQLYINQGDLKFKNVGASANIIDPEGFPTGSTAVDINNDGRLDIYVCKSGKYTDPELRKNKLYVNQGNDSKGMPMFEEAAAKYNLDISHCSTQASFFDYDKDGDLDMFLINHDPNTYGDDDIPAYKGSKGGVSGERLYKNTENNFEDVTESAGIVNNRLGYGLGVAIGDLNNDQWPDIYVSNDFSGKDHLYINLKDGTFLENIARATKQIPFFSMGNDIADYNNDGLLDIVSVDMSSEDNYSTKTSMSGMNPARFWNLVELGEHFQYMYNTLQLNNGASSDTDLPMFSNVAQMAGVASTDWSWGPLFMDMDNDGFKDLFVSNGIKRDFRNNDFVNYHKKVQAEVIRTQKVDKENYIKEVLPKMPPRPKENYFFRNVGDLTFEKKNGVWVDSLLTVSNGAAYADLDNDGDLDIVLNNMDATALIYENNTEKREKGNYLKVKFKGYAHNHLGIGARVTVNTEKHSQVQEHYLTRGFQSSVAPGLHFGLGDAKMLNELEVIWADGKIQVLKNIEANQLLVLDHKDAKSVGSEMPAIKTQKKFKDITHIVKLDHKHIENSFDDFKRESLLPHKMSQLGPALAVGDINNDSLDDFFIGGSMNSPSSLYVQKEDNTFARVQTELFGQDRQYEDVGAKFFDADNDGDLDLYVSSGGNERPLGSRYYGDRLYENNNGSFEPSPRALPDIAISGSCIRPFDYDGDGDLDLFLGGRQIPGKYPLPANSYILRNDSDQKGGILFSDVTRSMAPKFEKLGMVTDAVCTDIDMDGLVDIVIAGEWMPITVFKNRGDHFMDVTEEVGLSKDVGWWFGLAAADFDNDGDIDLVGGNLGLNYKYKATKDEPFEIYTTDFDESGDLDIVLGFNDKGNLYPLRGRECSSNQMPFIKSKFPTYDAFGKATLKEVYGENKLRNSTHYSATNFATSYFENVGNGRFKPKELPLPAQISSVNAILVEDFDQDGNLDLLLGGNMYGSEVETPRNDASYGLYLKGNGTGSFTAVSSNESGLKIDGEVRQMKPLRLSWEEEGILIAINKGELILLGKEKKIKDTKEVTEL